MSAVKAVANGPPEEQQDLSKEGLFAEPLVSATDPRRGRVRFEVTRAPIATLVDEDPDDRLMESFPTEFDVCSARWLLALRMKRLDLSFRATRNPRPAAAFNRLLAGGNWAALRRNGTEPGLDDSARGRLPEGSGLGTQLGRRKRQQLWERNLDRVIR